MNNKITNPFLKQLISEISTKASQGRIVDVSWGALNEVKKKKKKTLKNEAAPAKPAAKGEEDPMAGLGGDAEEDQQGGGDEQQAAGGEMPGLGGEEAADAQSGGEDAGLGGMGGEEGGEDGGDPDEAEADAAEAKAKVEKAKAEKDAAEKKLKDLSYIKLGSSSGTEFMLGKLVSQAFQSNSIDALAREMVEKLNIKTPDDIGEFTDEVAPYMSIPGMADLLTSMKSSATQKPEETEEETPEM